MTRACPEHEFIILEDIQIFSPTDEEKTAPKIAGKLIACAYCGERRKVWSNGQIEIIRQ